jgi:predicted RNase H-like nuclease (RuvC/YqgF family)
MILAQSISQDLWWIFPTLSFLGAIATCVYTVGSVKAKIIVKLENLATKDAEIEGRFKVRVSEISQRSEEINNQLDLKITEIKLKMAELEARINADHTSVEVLKSKMENIHDLLKEIKGYCVGFRPNNQ